MDQVTKCLITITSQTQPLMHQNICIDINIIASVNLVGVLTVTVENLMHATTITLRIPVSKALREAS